MEGINSIPEINKNPINKAMISHLYGVIFYTNEKLKGEAYQLIESSKNLKNKFFSKERLFFLDIPDIDIDSDFNSEINEYTQEIINEYEKNIKDN